MVKLPMPVICDCGFSTMDAKSAYDHAMKHEPERLDTNVLDNILSVEHRRAGLGLIEDEDTVSLIRDGFLVASWPATRATLLAIHQAADRCLARDGMAELEAIGAITIEGGN
jgi:hypothetical protein